MTFGWAPLLRRLSGPRCPGLCRRRKTDGEVEEVEGLVSLAGGGVGQSML